MTGDLPAAGAADLEDWLLDFAGFSGVDVGPQDG
jgi:hypothetical protein